MANKYRSDYYLNLGKEKILLRPTFQALAEIEGGMEKSIWVLLRSCETDGFTLQDIKTIITAAMVDKSLFKNQTVLEEHIINEGVLSITKQLVEFLMGAIN